MATVKIEQVLRTLIAMLLAVLAYVIYDSFHEHVVVLGDSAPDFTLVADDGRTYSASNFGGKLLVLNFWATWCPPCIDEIPTLDQFQRRFARDGVVVLAVSVDKDEKAYRNFLNRVKPGFVTARDPDNKINVSYGTFKFPETYIIDSHGKVVRKLINSQDWMSQRMIDDVQALLQS